jgi:Na+/H+ antiporter NhaD/arsenite permease-like protein
MDGMLISIIVFLLVYAAITFELVNKAVAAFSGVAILILLHVIDEHHAIEYIDFETIMLLFGMMIIVSVLKYSGLFTIVSVRISELTRGNPVKILILFSVITAIMSAFLDNVTTVLIIIPIIIELTRGLGLDPKKYVLSQAIISNIGGAATLIGDPPNVIIGSRVGLTFNQFLFNLGPPVIIIFIVVLAFIWLINRDQFKPIHNNIIKLFTVNLLLEKIRHDFLSITIDYTLMKKGLFFLLIAIILFITQTITGLAPGVIAISAGIFLVLVSGMNLEKVMEEVEWSTLMFFVGLFILVGSLEEYGVIEWIAHNVFLNIGENPYIIILVVEWVSGIASGFLDNIPFTITMIPIIEIMNDSNPHFQNLLWWALALGACLGGNITMIGASANIVSIGIAKKYGVKISFLDFMKFGVVISIISLIIASLYLILRVYLIL